MPPSSIPQDSIEDISAEQLERTFRTNIFAMFFMTKAALPHLEEGAAIINTTSVTAYRGSPALLDYSSTKGAIVPSRARWRRGWRSKRHPRQRGGAGADLDAADPVDLRPEAGGGVRHRTCRSAVPASRTRWHRPIVFLASDDGSYMTGQVLHPNGGEIVNG